MFLEAAGTIFALVAGTVVVTAAYRLFVHPLAHIPGPKLAALTNWYEFYYDAIQPGRYIFKIQELHRRYGPVVRIAPDELHVNDVSFIDTVYAPSSVKRDKYEYQLRTLRIGTAVGTTADFHLHRKRREALNPFFSKWNVLHLEPVINSKVQQLQGILKKHADEKSVVNLSDVFFAFANDVAVNFCFAHQTNLLSDEPKAAVMRHNSNQLLLGIKVNQHFPLLVDLLESLPLSISKDMMPPGLIDMMELSARVREELEDIQCKDPAGGELKALHAGGKESVFHTLLNSPNLPPSEKALLRLEQEGSLIVLAGTESPAKTLSLIFYHLAENPSIMAKLRAELDTLPSNATWKQAEQLPYLSAVIEEGNRISFGVTARTARIAPEPLTYTSASTGESVVIPAGTPVSISTLSAHTDEAVFPDPYAFKPDRWLGEEGAARRKYNLAFNHGGRRCIGIELARAELYLVTATLARNFELELYETGPDDVAFYHDYQISMPKLDSKGVQVMPKFRA